MSGNDTASVDSLKLITTPEEVAAGKVSAEQMHTLYQQLYVSTEKEESAQAKNFSQQVLGGDPWPEWLARKLCNKKESEPWPYWIFLIFSPVSYLKMGIKIDAINVGVTLVFAALSFLVIFFRDKLGFHAAGILFYIFQFAPLIILPVLWLLCMSWISGKK